MRRLITGLSLLLFAALAPALAQATNDPARIFERVRPSLLRVELDLQYSRGEPPTGIIDQDAGAGGARYHTLAQVISQERPLETTGYLIGERDVVALDANVHPRFIKAIRVLGPRNSTTARIVAQARNQWAMRLQLDATLDGAQPLEFGDGKPAYTVTYFRLDGAMVSEAAPFSSRFELPDSGTIMRHHEHGGVCITADGTPVGILISRRVGLDGAWLGSPDRWSWDTAADLERHLSDLAQLTREGMVRVRLSFRSPKLTAAQQRMRFNNQEDDDDSDATERDVPGILVSERRLLILAALKPKATARLERILVHRTTGTPVPARFVSSLRDFGALVADLEGPLSPVIPFAPPSPYRDVGSLHLRADIQLFGEQWASHFHTARVASQRTGPRMESYPELVDMSDVSRVHLFNFAHQLVALPVVRRDNSGRRSDPGSRVGEQPILTPGHLLASALQGLPATADPGNTPLPESEENRIAWLGVELQPLGRELARANGVADQTRDGETGAMVTYVHADSPAAKAGVTPGAILLRVHATSRPAPIEVRLEEDELRSTPFPWDRLDDIREQFFERLPTPWPPAENSFTRTLTDLGFSREYSAEFFADGRQLSHTFQVVQGPVHYEAAPRFKSESIGLTVRNLTYDVRRYLQRRPEEPGVVVARVEPGGKASVAGVKPFEIITHINDQPVGSIADFENLSGAGGELRFSMKRMSKGRIVTIRPTK